MPTSSLNSDGFRSIYQQYRDAMESWPSVELRPDGTLQYQAAQRVDRRRQIKEIKDWEKDNLQVFLDTGMPGMLTCNTAGGKLFVYGRTLRSMKLMFILDSDELTVHSKRCTHLMPQLTALANNEGVALTLVDEYPTINDNYSLVAFWNFKQRPEQDDTDIVKQAQANIPEEAVHDYTVTDNVYGYRPIFTNDTATGYF